MRTLECAAVLAAAVLFGGCGDDASKGGAKAPAGGGPVVEEPGRGHEAPHGGELLELGEHEAHLELIHDHAGGHVTVYVLDGDLKTPVDVPAPTIVIATKEGPKEFTLTAVDPKPDGTAHTWKGSHAGLVSDPWDGRIRVKVRGKDYQSPLEGEAHGH